MTSIFDIEKRLPINIECKRINELIKKNEFYIRNDNSFYNLYQIIDNYLFLKWSHRHTATCLNDFFDYFDINFQYYKDRNIYLQEHQCLYYLETLVNFIAFLINDINNPFTQIVKFSDYVSINEFIKSLSKNIDITLESVNMKKYDANTSMIRFTKRDADADAAIIAANDRDIALDILSFLDFRNENNINEKKSIITRLYKHLEANQSIYKSIRIKSSAISKDINPYDDFFLLANKFDIRHHPKDLLKNGSFQKLDDNRTKEVLDICFRLFLRIVNTSQAVVDQDYINNLKQEFNII